MENTFRIGKDNIGSTVHVMYDDADIMFFDARGRTALEPATAKQTPADRESPRDDKSR